MPDEHARAFRLDRGLEQLRVTISLPSSRDVMAQVRTYLQNRNVNLKRKNNVLKILKEKKDQGIFQVSLGPSIDKGPEESHFHFESGSRLSFGISLRESEGRCALLAYRFQVNFPATSPVPFLRFDLNPEAHPTPLFEPKCHYHPGSDEIRLPCPPLMPLEVLDRIFFVIEPQLNG